MQNIVIQGLGFVGSAMAVAVASKLEKKGKPLFNVTGIDLPNSEGKAKINSINSGNFPFKTNDNKLTHELKKAIKRGNLKATYSKESYSKADIIIISINCDLITDNGQKKVALSKFKLSVSQIAENISEDTLVIVESTVPPGTCQKIVYPLFKDTFIKRKLDFNMFFLAHSYERVMPGDEYFDSIVNYWRVFSGINNVSANKCESFLSRIINIDKYPLSKLSNTTASETAKLLENSYRAVNISFIEEWARFAEDVGIDLYEIIDAIRMRPTHNNIRQPGFGVGGYCLTKDPLFAKISARDILKVNGHEFPFSSKAIQINSKMPYVTLNKINNYFKRKVNGKKILLMGATYRQDIADTRFSASETFFKKAISQGYQVSVFDPLVEYWYELKIDILNQLPDSGQFDVIVFAVSHKEFANINLDKWVGKNNTLLFDANNVLTNKQIREIKENNINYISIGRG